MTSQVASADDPCRVRKGGAVPLVQKRPAAAGWRRGRIGERWPCRHRSDPPPRGPSAARPRSRVSCAASRHRHPSPEAREGRSCRRPSWRSPLNGCRSATHPRRKCAMAARAGRFASRSWALRSTPPHSLLHHPWGHDAPRSSSADNLSGTRERGAAPLVRKRGGRPSDGNVRAGRAQRWPPDSAGVAFAEQVVRGKEADGFASSHHPRAPRRSVQSTLAQAAFSAAFWHHAVNSLVTNGRYLFRSDGPCDPGSPPCGPGELRAWIPTVAWTIRRHR